MSRFVNNCQQYCLFLLSKAVVWPRRVVIPVLEISLHILMSSLEDPARGFT